jgi:AbrB family transcriptional regulator, transcriptional pleiotropic regulator of transition state genes
MKSVGIVRKIDQLGRLCIPREILLLFGIPLNSAIEIFTEGDAIYIKKYEGALSLIQFGVCPTFR